MAEREEGLWMSTKERDRLKVLHEVKRRHITQKQAGAELGLSERRIRELLLRVRRRGDEGLRHGLRGRASNRKTPEKVKRRVVGHLSRKLCLRDSCRDLEAGLKHGIELVKYTSDIASQALPLTLLERRDGEAELELERVLGVEVPTTVTSHDFQLAINGLDDIGGGQRTTNGFWTVEKGQVVQAFLA